VYSTNGVAVVGAADIDGIATAGETPVTVAHLRVCPEDLGFVPRGLIELT
jgi:hypothetical protein